jgi:hypothetical protein
MNKKIDWFPSSVGCIFCKCCYIYSFKIDLIWSASPVKIENYADPIPYFSILFKHRRLVSGDQDNPANSTFVIPSSFIFCIISSYCCIGPYPGSL